MSQLLISHSPDLKRLQDEGYDVDITGAFLVIYKVPYVNDRKEVRRGTLVSKLNLAGNKAHYNGDHVAYLSGGTPCDKNGAALSKIINNSRPTNLTASLIANVTFSSKPKPNGYKDYYDKVITYIRLISGHAQSIDPNATAANFEPIRTNADNLPFQYLDTNSSRAEINNVSDKLMSMKVGIVGLGGTGSYILDFVSKSPVSEIHLFDADYFYTHNAFRAPGATSIGEFGPQLKKVEYFARMYSNMHKHVVPHDTYITEENVDELAKMDFIFLSIDSGAIKEKIVSVLEDNSVRFIDVGMGIEKVDDSLIGVLRVTTSTETKRNHIRDKSRISFADNLGDEAAYSSNIQIAELNALNATMAVIKWKKLYGFYQDLENEHYSTYSINVNMLLSEDKTES